MNNKTKTESILEIAKKYLKEKNINVNQLETDNAGGMCWWFAQDFSKYLTDNKIPNKVINMTGDKGFGNHLVVKVDEDYIDFTFNQFESSEVPVIKKKNDYDKYYNDSKEFGDFDEFVKQWYGGEEDEEWKEKTKEFKKPIIGEIKRCEPPENYFGRRM